MIESQRWLGKRNQMPKKFTNKKPMKLISLIVILLVSTILTSCASNNYKGSQEQVIPPPSITIPRAATDPVQTPSFLLDQPTKS